MARFRKSRSTYDGRKTALAEMCEELDKVREMTLEEAREYHRCLFVRRRSYDSYGGEFMDEKETLASIAILLAERIVNA